MADTNKRLSNICSLILGATYIISGILKSFTAGKFAEQLQNYGVIFPEYIASAIIIVEIMLGILLALCLRQRLTAKISIALLMSFTAVYTYGLLSYNISDCGCFGNARELNSSPLVIYLRNLALMAMSVYVYKYPISRPCSQNNSIIACVTMIIGVGTVSFFMGHSYKNLKNKTQTLNPIAIADTPLKNMVNTHPDSTYLVFVFSFSCQHCLNSIANLNNYESDGAVDKVLGITSGSEQEYSLFWEKFSPTFQIINTPGKIQELAKELPTSYYIRNDSIMIDFSGEIPCSVVFSELINKYLPPK